MDNRQQLLARRLPAGGRGLADAEHSQDEAAAAAILQDAAQLTMSL